MEGVQVKLQVFLFSALVGSEIHAFAFLRVTKRLCYESASRIFLLQDLFGCSAEQTGLLGKSNHDSSAVQPVTQSLCDWVIV